MCNGLKQCSFGARNILLNKCHSSFLTRKIGLVKFINLNEADKYIILNRSDILQYVGLEANINTLTICLHHLEYYLNYYPKTQKSCCGLISTHKKPFKKNLRVVTKDTALKIKRALNIDVKIGQKICDTCRKKIHKKSRKDKYNKNDDLEISLNSDVLSPCVSCISPPSSPLAETITESCNRTLQNLNVSPINLHALKSNKKNVYFKS